MRKFYSLNKMWYAEFFTCQCYCREEKPDTRLLKIVPQKIPALDSIVLSHTNWAFLSCFHWHVLPLPLDYWVEALLKPDDSHCLLMGESSKIKGEWQWNGVTAARHSFVKVSFYKISACSKALGHICSIASFVFRKYF